MTIKQVRKYLKGKVKPQHSVRHIESEYYESSFLPIEKQINEIRTKGPGIHTFLYLKCKGCRIIDGKQQTIGKSCRTEKISISL